MSHSPTQLVRQAASKMDLAEALLRTASLESSNLEAARELWERAKAVEGMAKAMKEISGSPEDESP